jgi:hypothetical protein
MVDLEKERNGSQNPAALIQHNSEISQEGQAPYF